MAKYFNLISYTVIFIFFILFDLVSYYGYGRNHSLVPFYLGVFVTVIVGIIAIMALYETFKHRNDKEPW